MSADTDLVHKIIRGAFDPKDSPPEIGSFDTTHRRRLINSLRAKYGDAYMNNKRASSALRAFESEMSMVNQIVMLRSKSHG